MPIGFPQYGDFLDLIEKSSNNLTHPNLWSGSRISNETLNRDLLSISHTITHYIAHNLCGLVVYSSPRPWICHIINTLRFLHLSTRSRYVFKAIINRTEDTRQSGSLSSEKNGWKVLAQVDHLFLATFRPLRSGKGCAIVFLLLFSNFKGVHFFHCHFLGTNINGFQQKVKRLVEMEEAAK